MGTLSATSPFFCWREQLALAVSERTAHDFKRFKLHECSGRQVTDDGPGSVLSHAEEIRAPRQA